MSKKAAVILSGCGFLDGAEIRESVLSLLHLDEAEAHVSIFAPDKEQHHVVNHMTSTDGDAPRNILIEAARIARCKIRPLTELNESEFDCLVIPGGFGVAKNLSTFAFDGPKGSVDDTVKKVIIDFNDSKKPIAAICIAPALISLCLGHKNITVTIGSDEGTAQAIEQTGAKHQNSIASDCVIDQNNKIISTAAYMFDDARLKDINQGIRKCIIETLALTL